MLALEDMGEKGMGVGWLFLVKVNFKVNFGINFKIKGKSVSQHS